MKFSASHSRFVFSVIKKEACEVEHSYVSLSCSNGQLLNVVDATYGRLETNICSSDNFDETCSDNVLSVVSDRLWKIFLDWTQMCFRCDALQNCSIQASNANFGDPCSGSGKRLHVEYTCTGKVWIKVLQWYIVKKATDVCWQLLNIQKYTMMSQQDASYCRTPTSMETILLGKWWRPSRLVLTSASQLKMDISGRGNQRASTALSKVQAPGEETMQWQCLETENVDQESKVGKMSSGINKKLKPAP